MRRRARGRRGAGATAAAAAAPAAAGDDARRGGATRLAATTADGRCRGRARPGARRADGAGTTRGRTRTDADLAVPVWVDRAAGPVLGLVRALPALARRRPPRHLRATSRGAARPGRGDGLRRALPAADPPDRRDPPQGPNNTPAAEPGDVGSPWAIGAADGGHTAVHPELGTVADVRRLAAACAKRGIELALDLAFQCSPDHPWVTEHPEWFRHRPDGSIQYAENPPKRYQDIYPLDFESEDWRRPLAGAARRRALLDRPGRLDLPRRQPAHQAVRVLGVADRRGDPRPPRDDLPGRGVHPAEGDGAAGQGRLHPVLHLLHLAQRQARARGVPARADADRPARVLPAELLAEHAGHPHRADADRRPADLRRPARAGGHALAQLRHLRAGLRARRAARPAAGQRGVPRLREVPAARLGHGERRTRSRRSSRR